MNCVIAEAWMCWYHLIFCFPGHSAAAWHRIQFYTCATHWPSWWLPNKPNWWKVLCCSWVMILLLRQKLFTLPCATRQSCIHKLFAFSRCSVTLDHYISISAIQSNSLSFVFVPCQWHLPPWIRSHMWKSLETHFTLSLVPHTCLAYPRPCPPDIPFGATKPDWWKHIHPPVFQIPNWNSKALF